MSVNVTGGDSGEELTVEDLYQTSEGDNSTLVTFRVMKEHSYMVTVSLINSAGTSSFKSK